MKVKVVEFRRNSNNNAWVLENTLAEWKDADPWCAINYMGGYVAAMSKYRKVALSCPCVMQLEGYMFYNHQMGYMIAAVDENNIILKNI